MLIRPLLPKELSTAIQLKISCWTEELADRAENTLHADAELAFWTHWLDTADEYCDIRTFIGVFEGEELAGVAAASFIESKNQLSEGIELNGLWVFPQYRGQGLSLKLLLAILDIYMPLGVESMQVYNLHHAPSNSFYRKLGGQVIRQEHQMAERLPVDIFAFCLRELRLRLRNTLLRYE